MQEMFKTRTKKSVISYHVSPLYSKTINNRRGGLITSRGVVLVVAFVVLVLVSVVPGVVLVVIGVVASHYCY